MAAIEQVEERLNEHEEIHERFDRRISVNENWRLQMMGALKFAAFTVGTSLTIFGIVLAAGLL